MNYESWMRRAIAIARAGMRAGNSPFGCCIVKNEQVISVAHNQVLDLKDPTSHAEINGISSAARRLRSIHLTDVVMYTTCEPCPMCLAACHWARIPLVVYGSGIDDAKAAGFNELQLPSEKLIEMGGGTLKLVGGVLRDECKDLFEEFVKSEGLAY